MGGLATEEIFTDCDCELHFVKHHYDFDICLECVRQHHDEYGCIEDWEHIHTCGGDGGGDGTGEKGYPGCGKQLPVESTSCLGNTSYCEDCFAKYEQEEEEEDD